MDIHDYITAKERLTLFKPKKHTLWHHLIKRFETKQRHNLLNAWDPRLTPQRQSIWIGNNIQIIVLGYSNELSRIEINLTPALNRKEIRVSKRGSK